MDEQDQTEQKPAKKEMTTGAKIIYWIIISPFIFIILIMVIGSLFGDRKERKLEEWRKQQNEAVENDVRRMESVIQDLEKDQNGRSGHNR